MRPKKARPDARGVLLKEQPYTFRQRKDGSVASVDRSQDALVVAFESGVDRSLLEEVVTTEQDCCTFLAIDYDDNARVLSVGVQDEQGREVVRRLAEFFGEGR